ncbi:protein phosphatase 2C domain-containing protein [Streptomyces sp. NPDC014734]|uniref:protein phosphatase 2C domain-containing protein n=1 Tax=Streptomyces sp. NPDC014734 TaxID=3364886 RepID=UPI00370145BB
MSQQGERPAEADDWWGRLYDEVAGDAGASDTADSLDDRFDSASGAVAPGRGDEAGDEVLPPAVLPPPAPVVSGGTPDAPAGPRSGAESLRPSRARAPWEPPEGTSPAPGSAAADPPRPRTFVTPSSTRTPPVPAEAPAAPEPPAGGGTGAREEEQERACEPVSRPTARLVIGHVGERPPTYDAEPTALPVTVPDELDGLVAADTVLDGARYGTYTLRSASVRGDAARFCGEPRRDAMLTSRFGADRAALVLVAVATGARAAEYGHVAAADACRWIGGVVGRSHARLAEDIRAGRRDDLRAGLHRLTDRGYGKLRARAAELGLEPGGYTAGLRCLLLSADPDCRTRIFFGVGDGALLRLRDGDWQDLDPQTPPPAAGETGEGTASRDEDAPGRATAARPSPPSARTEDAHTGPAAPFRFRASVARPGDTLLLCSPGLAEPLRGEPALARELAARWAGSEAPGLAAFLADTQLRVEGYSDDRTAAAVWEA